MKHANNAAAVTHVRRKTSYCKKKCKIFTYSLTRCFFLGSQLATVISGNPTNVSINTDFQEVLLT